VTRAQEAGGLALAGSLGSRLAEDQRLALHANRALLLLALGRLEPAAEVAAALAAAAPRSQLAAMLAAAVLAKQGRPADADAALAAFCAAQPALALQPTLMRAQLALEAGDARGALARLASVPDPSVQTSAAVVATRVALHEHSGDAAGAESLLQQVVSYWQQRPAELGDRPRELLGWCLSRLVAMQLRAGRLGDALRAHAAVRAMGVDSAATAGVQASLLRAAAAADDAAALTALRADLPAPPSGRGVDVRALEGYRPSASAASAAAIPVPASALAAAAAAAPAASAASPAPAAAAGGGKAAAAAATPTAAARKRDASAAPPAEGARKHKRGKRLPKGFDVSKPSGGLPQPDPERWLPKWQRAEARKRRSRRRDGPAVKGSQGAGKVDEQLDRSGAPPPEPAASPSAGAAKPVGPPKGKGGKRR